MRTIPGTRMLLPEPALAWVFLVVGVLLLAIGTAAAVRVLAHMWGGTRSLIDVLIALNRPLSGYFLHDYDEPDKVLMGVLLVGRVPGVILTLWGLAGLIW